MSEPKPAANYDAIKCAAFTVDGEPVPKARPRLGRGGHAYTPSRTAAWEERVGWAYREAQGPEFHGPVQVALHFRRKSRRRADLDNLIKSVLDGLNGVAWQDDSQVKCIQAYLVQTDDGAGVDVQIEQWRSL